MFAGSTSGHMISPTNKAAVLAEYREAIEVSRWKCGAHTYLKSLLEYCE